MSDTLNQLIANIETEHLALVAALEANLSAEVEEDLDGMIKRQRELEPIMLRLGEATGRLTKHAGAEGLPDDLMPRIDEWRQQLIKLNEALAVRSGDLAKRRELIAKTVRELKGKMTGLAGYRLHPKGDARFIRKQA